jgi:phosphoribosylanthranilate isomerase
LRTRVKICGITNLADAQKAVSAGADAIGLVFYPSSPRYVNPAEAAHIASRLAAFVNVVGLFVNATAEEIKQVIHQVPLQLLQFHGDETAEFCRQFNLPYIRAVRVHADTNLIQYALQFHDARALLLDTYVDGVAGGTGQVFDWQLIPPNFPIPIVLAGGLSPSNVRQAIQTVKPYAVDVSGGVEQSKGIKSKEKIAAFMRGVRYATL